MKIAKNLLVDPYLVDPLPNKCDIYFKIDLMKFDLL